MKNKNPTIRYKLLAANRGGFTLVELILYVALVSLFMTAAILFAWDVIYGREKSFRQQTVQQVGRAALLRIGYEIENADNIVSLTPGNLVLGSSSGDTTITLDSGRLSLTKGAVGPFFLTSNQVNIAEFNVTSMASLDNNTKGLSISLTLTQAGSATKGELTSQTQLVSSYELNNQFNDARRLLINVGGANLVSGNSLQGITIENVGTGDIVIDKMKVSVKGTTNSTTTGVQIGSGTVEFSGEGANNSTLELSNFTVTSASGANTIDFINFGTNVLGEVFDFSFVMADGSESRARVLLGVVGTTPTPVPTPTPTPTAVPTPTPTPPPPATSCSQVCINNSYTTGTCRRNAAACTSSGETYVPTGDIFCTGGPNADTCCCK